MITPFTFNNKDIEDNMKLLNDRKTTSPDSIPTKILKQLKNSVWAIEYLNKFTVYNICFSIIAEIETIVPLYKKDNKLECNNYRRISLLSNIGKRIEKLLHKRLHSFLYQTKC